MLVLSRKLNQSIQIGENISVRIVRIKGNAIQLGIDAPQEVHVLRSELIAKDAKAAARQQAASDKQACSTDEELKRDDEIKSETAQALFTALRVISSTPVGRPPMGKTRHTNLTIVT